VGRASFEIERLMMLRFAEVESELSVDELGMKFIRNRY